MDKYSLQQVLYKYGFASALGYGVSMFAEALQDRRFLSLREDLLVLIFGTFLPVLTIIIDAHSPGDAVSDWRQFAP